MRSLAVGVSKILLSKIMKLFHWQNSSGIANFGDDLNRLIWMRLVPDLLDDDETVTFVAIGSILNHWLPTRTSGARKRLIFSSGVGYGNPLRLDESYKVYCVRGPLSAKSLGLPPDKAIADGAILIQKVFQANHIDKRYKFSYMPHYKLASSAWEGICEDIGLGYIDPRWSVDKVLQKLSQTEVLLCEAMHGAIVADALRIPWIPIVSDPQILRFKWEDWCQSIGVNYKPELVDYPSYKKPSKKDALFSLRQLKCYGKNYLIKKKVAQQLLHITQQTHPILSNEGLLSCLISKLEEKLEHLRADAAAFEIS